MEQLTRFNPWTRAGCRESTERTPLEEVGDGTEFVFSGRRGSPLWAYLKRFLFSDDHVATKVKHLSGGSAAALSRGQYF